MNTARSLWAYASSENQLRDRLKVLIATYESDRRRIAAKPDTPLTLTESRIKWSRSLERSARRIVAITFDPGRIRESTFRPFQAQKVYFDRLLNDQTYSLFRFFPTPELGNVGIVVTDVSSHAPFSFLMVGRLPDMHTLDTGQYFPRWRYEAAQEEGVLDFCDSDGDVIRGYRRVDNITDAALNKFRSQYITLTENRHTWPAPAAWSGWFAGAWESGPVRTPDGCEIVKGPAWRNR